MKVLTFLDWILYDNSLQSWILALLVMSSIFVLLTLIKRITVQRARTLASRTATSLDDLAVDLLKRTNIVFLLIVSMYLGSLLLTLSGTIVSVISTVTMMAVFVQIAIWGNELIGFWVERTKREQVVRVSGNMTTIVALGFVSKLILWTVILLLVLDNLGVEITALIAGLGIGGIAIGLAVQNILGDLFASLSIMLDRPFEIGDFIIVGDFLGTVEYVGLKTTRVRSLSGEQLVFSNSDLLQSRIRNYKRMGERRVVFSIGVVYQTPHEKLAAIPAMLQEIIESQEKVRFDRAHFYEYGESSLNFEIVYYVLDADYNLYMDIQQAINLEIFRRFEEESIDFAYPTQTLHIEGKVGPVLTRQTMVEPARNGENERETALNEN